MRGLEFRSSNNTGKLILLAATALVSMAGSGAAWAQNAAAAGVLDEVVVTATRQNSTVNRVPLSISASTQQSLDQQGVKTIADLQRTVPALSVSTTQGGVQNFAIRGIYTQSGAATTGVYLDDVALQKRFVAGPVASGTTANGSPAPPLFDLDRVEVLRGPQGTLYGGSSEGGTVRFITPAPSLTTYSGIARAEVSTVKDGGVSREEGFAVGGPIIKDKLGFRASVLDRRTAGYIDMVDPYRNGALVKKDANSGKTFSGRLSVLWAPTDRAKVTFGLMHFMVKDDGGMQQWNKPVAGTFTTPSSCYNTTRQFGQSPAPNAAVACPANAVPGQTVAGIYMRPSNTYGPFPYLGRNKALGTANYLSPIVTKTDVGNINLDYDFGPVSLKLISSYFKDETVGDLAGPTTETSNLQVTTAFPGARGFPLFSPVQDFIGRFNSFNRRQGYTEELRLSSAQDKRLTWVAGLYFSHLNTDAEYHLTRDYASRLTGPLYGLTVRQVYGFDQAPQPPTSPGNREQNLTDTELAGFGEANFHVTDKLTAIAGLRVSRTEFKFYQASYGISLGYLVPTLANGGLTVGAIKETPITPKVGLQYAFTPTRMVYATAAKGFRPGGVNTPLNADICAAGLAAAGLKASDIPKTYDSDSVWSYEAGSKLRVLDNRVQLNASVFQIDWKGVQVNINGFPGCSQSWVQNAGSARSRGFDLDLQAKLVGGLSATLAAGRTDARYTQTVLAPAPVGAIGAPVVREGDRFPVPVWQANLGLRYDFMVAGRYGAYMRGDYFYQGGYFRSPGPGVTQFAPDTYKAPSTRQLNLRAGVKFDAWDANVFVNNALDSQDELTHGSTGTPTSGGRGGCSIAQGAACTTFTTYNPLETIGTLRPREAGVQVSYHF